MQIPTTRENLERYAAGFTTVKFLVSVRADPVHPFIRIEIPVQATLTVFKRTVSKLLGMDVNKICIYAQDGDEIGCAGTVYDLHDRYGDRLWAGEQVGGVMYTSV